MLSVRAGAALVQRTQMLEVAMRQNKRTAALITGCCSDDLHLRRCRATTSQADGASENELARNGREGDAGVDGRVVARCGDWKACPPYAEVRLCRRRRSCSGA